MVPSGLLFGKLPNLPEAQPLTRKLIWTRVVEPKWALARALEAEIRGWVEHDHTGITAAIHALDDYSDSDSQEALLRAENILAALANWPAQAGKKLQLSDSLSTLLVRADQVWPEDSVSECADTWRNLIRPKLAERSGQADYPRGVAEDYAHIVEVLGSFSSLLRNLLSHHGKHHRQMQLAFEQKRGSRSRRIPVAESVLKAQETLRSLPDRLSVAYEPVKEFDRLPETNNLQTALDVVRRTALGLADATREILERYKDFSDEPLDAITAVQISSDDTLLDWLSP